MKNMKNILISGYYGFHNTGDELVLQEIIRGLKNKNPEYNISVLSADPEYTKEKYEVESYNRWNIFQILKSIIKTDVLVSGGGSLLQDKTSKNGILYYLGIILMSKLFRKKVYIFSQGIGPVSYSRNRKLLKFVLEKVDYISVRENDSLKLLRALGINKDIELSGDPVFLIEDINEKNKNELWDCIGLDNKKKLITVSLRPWENSQRIVKETLGFLQDFDRDEFQVRFLSFHHGEDEKIIEGIVPEEEIIKLPLKPEEVAVLIGSSYLTVGMRLHSLILAASQKVRFISIAYDPKVEALDKEIYNSGTYIDVDNISRDILMKKYLEIKDFIYENEGIKKRANKPFELFKGR